MQMIGGGISLFIMAILIGEFQHFAFANITLRALYAWLYLIVFGSFIGFSAFNYLLAKVSPDKVATAGYVNPIVALFLGWGLNNEAVSIQSIVAALILLVSVFLINSGKRRIGMVGRWRRMRNKPKAS